MGQMITIKHTNNPWPTNPNLLDHYSVYEATLKADIDTIKALSIVLKEELGA